MAGPGAQRQESEAGWQDLVREDAGAARGPEHAETLLSLQRSAGNASVLGILRAVAPPSAGAGDAPAATLLASPEGAVAFLDAVEAEVTAVAARELGPALFTLRGCPWIDHWIAYYRTQPPERVEEAVRRYAPAAAHATKSEDAVRAVAERVSEGIASWRETGQLPELPSDSPGTPPGEQPAGGQPAFKLRPDAPPPGPGASALAGRLGRGEPLDGGLRDQVGAAYGANLSHVRVHRDTTAGQAVSGLGARAATVGQDIAFAPGEYEPGTPAGDALIAHELAHVVQQDTPGGGASSTAVLERDADAAAVSAVVARWVPGFERPGRVPMAAAPGLRLQRCHTHGGYEPDSERIAKEAGIVLNYEPEMEKIPVGLEARFELSETHSWPKGGSHGVKRWGVRGPSDSSIKQLGMSKLEPMGRANIVFDEPGEWLVAAEFDVDGQHLVIGRTLTVVPADDVMNAALDQTPAADYITHRQRLAEERSTRAKGGALDQNYGGAYISNEGPEAANPGSISSGRFEYQIHPGPPEPGKPAPVKYRWWAIPYDDDDRLQHRTDLGTWTEYEGVRALYRGERERVSFVRQEHAKIEMVCEMVAADGSLVGKAHYTQVILDSIGMKDVKQIDTFMKEAGEDYRAIEKGKAEGLRAVHLDVRTGRVSQLSLFVGPSAEDGGFTLVDLTPGAERAKYHGATVRKAIDDFADGNAHGKGRIDIEYAGPPPLHLTMETHGSSGLEERAKKAGLAGMIVAGIGALMAVTPLAPAAPYVIAAGLGAGAAASGASLIAELRKAHPSASKIALDMTVIVSSLAGVGATAKAVQLGSVELTMASAAGRLAVYTGFASDAIGGVLIGFQTADQIEQIRNSHLSEDDKIDMITRLVFQAMAVGSFLVFGAKDLGAARTRASTILGEELAGRLKAEVLYGLHSLDDAALLSLKGLERGEIDAIAKALARDPKAAERLSQAYGKEFIAELRANPARSLEEIGDILAARTSSAGQVGGPHGWDHPTAEAGKGVGDLSEDRLGKAIKPIGKASRVHPTKWVGEKVQKGSATITLEVTPRDGQPFRLVVTVEAKPAGTVGTAVQKGNGRVAQIEAPKAAGEPWTMRYEVDGELSPDALPHVLGRGLDEASDWIARSAATKAPFAAEAGPSLFTPWAARGPGHPTPPVTAGDRAAARELLGVMVDIRRIESDMTKQQASLRKLRKTPDANAGAIANTERAIAALEGKLKSRKSTSQAMRLDMGMYDPEHLEAKLGLLRDTKKGMAADEVKDLEHAADTGGQNALDRLVEDSHTVASETEHRVLEAHGKPMLKQEDVTHLMRANPADDPAGFHEWGIGGGHYDPYLKEFVAANPEYVLVEIERAQAGAGTVVHYEQYMWKGKGRPPRPGEPGYPVKGAKPSAADWQECVYPKTTFSDADAFLAYADGQVATWKGAQTPPVAHGAHPVGGDPPLVIIGSIDKDGTLNLATVYIDAGWIDKTGAAQRTPTPVPTR